MDRDAAIVGLAVHLQGLAQQVDVPSPRELTPEERGFLDLAGVEVGQVRQLATVEPNGLDIRRRELQLLTPCRLDLPDAGVKALPSTGDDEVGRQGKVVRRTSVWSDSVRDAITRPSTCLSGNVRVWPLYWKCNLSSSVPSTMPGIATTSPLLVCASSWSSDPRVFNRLTNAAAVPCVRSNPGESRQCVRSARRDGLARVL